MKLTKSHLKQIIKEELQKTTLKEQNDKCGPKPLWPGNTKASIKVDPTKKVLADQRAWYNCKKRGKALPEGYPIAEQNAVLRRFFLSHARVSPAAAEPPTGTAKKTSQRLTDFTASTQRAPHKKCGEDAVAKMFAKLDKKIAAAKEKNPKAYANWVRNAKEATSIAPTSDGAWTGKLARIGGEGTSVEVKKAMWLLFKKYIGKTYGADPCKKS